MLRAFLYPMVVRFAWDSDGFLCKMDYVDFAGSGVVNLVGGASALAACALVGPRWGRFEKDADTREVVDKSCEDGREERSDELKTLRIRRSYASFARRSRREELQGPQPHDEQPRDAHPLIPLAFLQLLFHARHLGCWLRGCRTSCGEHRHRPQRVYVRSPFVLLPEGGLVRPERRAQCHSLRVGRHHRLLRLPRGLQRLCRWFPRVSHLQGEERRVREAKAKATATMSCQYLRVVAPMS